MPERPHRPTTTLRRRAAVILLTAWMAVVGVGAPRPAHAIFTEILADVTKAIEEIVDASGDALKVGFTFALIDGVQTFVDNYAYQTAVWIASGAPGQDSLYEGRTGTDFLRDTALTAGFEMLDSIDRAFSVQFGGGDADASERAAGYFQGQGAFGITEFICAPRLPGVSLALQIGIAERLRPRKPKCSWQDISQRWDSFVRESDSKEVLSQVGASFEPGGSDLSIGLATNASLSQRLSETTQLALMDDFIDKWKDKKEAISGWSQTPGDLARSEVENTVKSLGSASPERTANATLNAIWNTETLYGLGGALVASTTVNFLRTLAAQAFQKQIIEKGLFDNLNLGAFVAGPINFGPGDSGPSTNRRQQAQLAYGDLKKPIFASTASNYDALSYFATCDMSSPDPHLNTCVIDDGFVRAIRGRMTLAEWVAAESERRAWQFVPGLDSGDRAVPKNSDVGCADSAFCSSNLSKLRQARIVPVGWELAANHPKNRQNPTDGWVTLGQLMDAFNVNGGDDVCGTLGETADTAGGEDPESPYCGLVDPNWVLAYPEQRCRLEGYSELLLSPSLPNREKVCRDVESCLASDENGRCITTTGNSGGYGYCVREENVWHLGGNSCLPYTASCRAYTGVSGTQLNVLTNTVDYGSCNVGNAGCLWYGTEWNGGEVAADVWDKTVTATARRYFSRNVQQCTQQNEGCTGLVPTDSATVNYVRNPSFEGGMSGLAPNEWEMKIPASNSMTTTLVAGDSGRGQAAQVVGSINNTYLTQTLSGRVPIVPGQPITASVRFRAPSGTNGFLYIGPSSATIPPISPSTTNSWLEWESVNRYGNTGIHGKNGITRNGNDAWQELVMTVVPKAEHASLTNIYIGLGINASNDTVTYDDVQVKLGDTPSAFHEGYGSGIEKTYLRIPPDSFRCKDPVLTSRHPSCAGFAQQCNVADVGCETYTPTSGIRAPVSATVSALDRCPAQCVGFAAYSEVPSEFDASSNFDYFIPKTATQCTLAEAGCSTFTNLDRAAFGGEAREQFTFLRRCFRPDDEDAVDLAKDANPATYYTWEGSAASGYQIQQYRLKASVWDTPASPPATFDGSGSCVAQYNKRFDEAGYDKDITPDCRAFYDQSGTIHYRRLSKTIIIEDRCTRYRLEHALTDVRGDEDTVNITTAPDDDVEDECDLMGGTLESGSCVIRGFAPESTSCSAAASGCRAYRGNTAGAERLIVETDFEPTSVGFEGWTGGNTPISSEAVHVADHSLSVTNTTAILPLATGSPLVPLLEPGGTYRVTVVAKGSGTATTVQPKLFYSESAFVEYPAATLGPSWQQLSFGPYIVPATTTATDLAKGTLKMVVSGSTAYLDSIRLERVPDLVTVIKNSWRTPPSCNLAADPAYVPTPAVEERGMLGCRAYTDRANTTHTLRSFTRLCDKDAVGCRAFYNTNNSDALGAQTFNAENDTGSISNPSRWDNVTIPADDFANPVYYVDRADKPQTRCQAVAEGCQRFGLPTLNRTSINADGDVTGWSDVFLRDDPDTYTGGVGALCQQEALFCEQWNGRDGSVAYFKNPGDRTCEWKENVPVGSLTRSGWFRTGTATPESCYTGFVDGATYGIRRNADTGYDARAGLCEQAHDQCTELRDPTDISSRYPDGQPYYRVRTSLNLSECTGTASRQEGCVLLQDTSNPARTWSAKATYAESEVSNRREAPIDCAREPSKCKRCVLGTEVSPGKFRHCEAPDGTLGSGCTEDADCAPLEQCVDGDVVGGTCSTDTNCDGAEQCLSAPFGNDANVLVKARRDRQCSQWYERSGVRPVTDPDTGEERLVSSKVKLVGSTGGVLRRAAPSYLSIDAYQRRDRSWGGEEYSGFAVPGRPGLEFLKSLTVDIGRPEERKVLFPVFCPKSDTPTNPTDDYGCGIIDGRCSESPVGAVSTGSAGDTCGPKIGGRKGKCYDGFCAYPPVGSQDGDGDLALPTWPSSGSIKAYNALEGLACRVYPEQDAPFPRDSTRGVLQDGDAWDIASGGAPEIETAYAGAYGQSNNHLCMDQGDNPDGYLAPAEANDRGGFACECSYQKASYQNGPTLYYSVGASTTPAICVNGRYDGQACNPEHSGKRDDSTSNFSCQASTEPSADDGTCARLRGLQQAMGLQGYCLERDERIPLYGKADLHPCESFYPVDLVSGTPDIYNMLRSAGYPGGDTFMCVQAKGNAYAGERPYAELDAGNVLQQLRYSSDTDSSRLTPGTGNHVVPIYPSGGSRYWVAARLESEYTTDGDENDKTLFTSARRGDVDVSDWENHEIKNMMFFNDQNFASTSSFIDRRDTTGDGTEWEFWNARGRVVYQWEIAEILFKRVTGEFDDAEGLDPSDIRLSGVNEWTYCYQFGEDQDENDVGQGYPGKTPTFTGTPFERAGGVWCWVNSRYNDGKRFGASYEDFCGGSQDVVTMIATNADGTTTSTTSSAPADKKYLGVSVEWNSDDSLEAIRTGYCNDVGTGNEASTAYDVFFKFREFCTDVAKVHEDTYTPGAATNSKPWTDRLWREQFRVSERDYTLQTPYPARPYGATSTTTTLATATGATLIGIWNSGIGGAPPDPTTSHDGGAPYTCSKTGSCIELSGFGAFVESSISHIDAAISRIQEVFVKVIDGKNKPDTANWKTATSTDWPLLLGRQRDQAETFANINDVPQVFSVGVTDADGVPSEGGVGMTVSGPATSLSDGTILGTDGRLDAEIQFFVTADPNHMPIRNIRVDAGDGVNEYSPSYGSYPTYRKPGTCKDLSAAVSTDTFNDIRGKGCADGPFTFTAIYDCPGSDAYGTSDRCDGQATKTGEDGWNVAWFEHGCWDSTFTHADDDGNTLTGACIFRPRVQVQDNWGYCTGRCGGDPAGDRCYGPTECTDTNYNSWIPFDGRIVVTPP